MQTRTRSLPVPSLGRQVIYLGAMPGRTDPVPMVGTVIAAPEDPNWNTAVTLEVRAPNGERAVIENVSCSSTPDLPQLGSFTWPRHVPNEDVLIGADGYVRGRATEFEKSIDGRGQLADVGGGTGGIGTTTGTANAAPGTSGATGGELPKGGVTETQAGS